MKEEYINKAEAIQSIKNLSSYSKEGEKIGVWIKDGDYFGALPRCRCSECNSVSISQPQDCYGGEEFRLLIPMVSAFKYCPVCGAKMHPEEDEK